MCSLRAPVTGSTACQDQLQIDLRLCVSWISVCHTIKAVKTHSDYSKAQGQEDSNYYSRKSQFLWDENAPIVLPENVKLPDDTQHFTFIKLVWVFFLVKKKKNHHCLLVRGFINILGDRSAAMPVPSLTDAAQLWAGICCCSPCNTAVVMLWTVPLEQTILRLERVIDVF